MLDTTVPHKKFFMKISEEDASALPPAVLPPGYSLLLYWEGGGQAWGEIQASVGGFDSVEEGEEFFRTVFLRHPQEVARRVLFVLDADGAPVATGSAWFAWDEDGKRIPILHWIATKPGEQGKGLGRAVVVEAIRKSLELDGGPIMLSTQTGSHVAMRLYHDLGFKTCRTAVFTSEKMRDGKLFTGAGENQFEEGLEVLPQVVEEEFVEQLRDAAI